MRSITAHMHTHLLLHCAFLSAWGPRRWVVAPALRPLLLLPTPPPSAALLGVADMLATDMTAAALASTRACAATPSTVPKNVQLP
jgi:hypothetical protein